MVNMVELYDKDPEYFLRDIGVTHEKFRDLLSKVIQWEENEKDDKPVKKKA